MLGNHISLHSCNLSLAENAPIYETNSDANKTSPMTLLTFASKKTTFSPQRLFYPAKPLTNFYAAVNLFLQRSASS